MHWTTRAALFTVSGVVTATISGGVLGLAGSLIDLPLRSAVTLLGATAAVVLACRHLLGHSSAPVQCNRETPQGWLRYGEIAWSLANGAALGMGATTRLGFWLWYVVPFASLMSASAVSGATIYGLYALARCGAAWPLSILVQTGRIDQPNLTIALLRRAGFARAISTAELFVLGVILLA